MRYKKGDKVRVKKFKEGPSYWNTCGKMEQQEEGGLIW